MYMYLLLLVSNYLHVCIYIYLHGGADLYNGGTL